eukprot:m.1129396 g.1129396  ORF g.1129396 m.1129396 type:complete len:67 (-) comp24418_c0_seq7:2815-3015(-)
MQIESSEVQVTSAGTWLMKSKLHSRCSKTTCDCRISLAHRKDMDLDAIGSPKEKVIFPFVVEDARG